ncbi:Mu transposase C-terminal domain-containing protein [Streptomyces filamentosus]|uniref:Mu transposase C-terminal domain-containing protein n=1 Tax=Streptomyces filamentosus TaxID=67294 RepID=UPI0033E391DB
MPLGSDDYVELLPVRWQAVTDAGIRFDYRTYDHPLLHGERAHAAGVRSADGKWEVHHNPYDPSRIWVRLADGFVEVPWIHATSVSLPFTHHVWEHICKVTKRTESRAEHEAQLVVALDDLLRRAARKKKLTGAEGRAVAKSRSAGALVGAPASEPNVLDTPTLSFGLAGVFAAPELDDETIPDEDDDLLLAAGQDLADPSDGSLVLDDTSRESDLWLP